MLTMPTLVGNTKQQRVQKTIVQGRRDYSNLISPIDIS